MMRVIQVATVLTSCFLIRFIVAIGFDPGTTFTKEQDTVRGTLGSNVTFHWTCAFGSSADKTHSEIIWGTIDDGMISNKYVTVKSGRSIINPDLSLSIRSRVGVTLMNITQHSCNVKFVLRKVTRSDETFTYGCELRKWGDERKSRPVRLEIQEPPRITNRSNATIDVDDGDNVKLQCSAVGVPGPSITWTKDKRPLPSSKGSVALPLTNIELKDAGSYVCTAKNDAGSDSYSVQVRVVRYRPHINMSASSNAIETSWLNRKTSLKCAVHANPSAKFTWFKKNGITLDGLNSSKEISTLILTPTTASDFGLYSCKATNIKGSAWHNITLERLYPPGPPIIVKLSPDMLSITVHWNKTLDNGGSPILDYKVILRDANNSVQQVRQGIRQNYFTLQNLRQNSTYAVVLQARNVVGYGRKRTTYVSTLVGDPPIILNVIAVPSLLSVNISWNSTNNNTGIPILDYKITITDIKTPRKREFAGIKASALHVTNLTHNTTYVVKVKARNEIGYGQSLSRTVTTLEADPPGPPMLKVVPSTFSLEITWNSSVQDINNIKILDYRIKLTDSTTHQQVAEHAALTRTRLITKNLERNRTYVVEIQARNDVGYGKTANTTATTILTGPPDAPLITSITVDGSRCVMKWTKPYNGESSIQMYTISIWVLVSAGDGSQNKQRLRFWNTTHTNYTLDVQWNHNYTTAVSAWNKYGQSISSEERHFKTGRFAQELRTTSTTPSATEDDTRSTTNVVSHLMEKSPVSKAESGADKKVKRNYLIYLAPLWIVILAFAVPAVVFMLWKCAQKIWRRCRRPRVKKRKHNGDSECSATVILGEMSTRTEANQYETITEIVETHFNHGFTKEDEKSSGDNYPKKQLAIPGYDAVYNHLFEAKPGPTKRTNLETGLGMFPNDVYSHLVHGEFLGDKKEPKVLNTSVLLAQKGNWEISPERLRIEATIGRGEFGLIKKGFALNVSKSGGWETVAVKTLKENDRTKDLCRKNLLTELSVMKDLSSHKHVVKLLACITKSEPLCIITEFAPYGDLLGFLRKKRGLADGYYNIDYLPQKRLTTKQLMQFAWEIADGMGFLSSEKIIHRDLAARNIVVGENLTCKVTDFGMARDIREMDIYQKTSAGRLPVKWTALEALLHGLYTTKSDVWSFGVVLFEIVTMGGCPYPDIEVLDLINKLENGYRMEKPTHISDKLYSLLLSCWNEDPERRPTFTLLYSTLNRLSKEDQDCINLKAYNGNLYENF